MKSDSPAGRPGSDHPRSDTNQESRRLRWPTWLQLRLLGNIQFFRVSYVVLVGVPLLAVVQHAIPLPEPLQDLRKMPLLLRLGYFSALLLSIAHMLYQGYCPEIIKRFDSPNDLYREMLEIKALQAQYLPRDFEFFFDIKHCRNNFRNISLKYWPARLACGICYLSGVLLFGAIVLTQAIRVLGFYPW